MNDHDHITAAARHLAATGAALEAAHSARTEAQAAIDQIAQRIAAAEHRQATARQQLGAGEISEREAGGLFAMAAADLADLEALHREARANLDTTVEAAREAQDAHAAAQAQFEREEARARLLAWQKHAQELDAALIHAVGELAEMARAAGLPANGLSAFFRPSAALSAMIRLGQVPTRKATT